MYADYTDCMRTLNLRFRAEAKVLRRKGRRTVRFFETEESGRRGFREEETGKKQKRKSMMRE